MDGSGSGWCEVENYVLGLQWTAYMLLYNNGRIWLNPSCYGKSKISTKVLCKGVLINSYFILKVPSTPVRKCTEYSSPVRTCTECSPDCRTALRTLNPNLRGTGECLLLVRLRQFGPLFGE